jgi:flagellar hook-length control protein FliK
MGFAANAVADVIAPPARTPNARPAPAARDERSFDDHLESTAPPPEAPDQQARPESPASVNEQAAAETPAPVETDAASTDAQMTAEAPAPALVVQIVQPPPQAPATGDTSKAEAKAEAPSAPQAPLAPAEAPESADSGEASNGAPPQTVKSGAKSDDASEGQARQQAAPVAAATSPQPQTTPTATLPTPASAQTPPPPPADATRAAQATNIASITPLATPQTTREAPQLRAAKPDAAKGVQTEAQPAEASGKSEAPQQAKSAPAANAPSAEAKAAPAAPQVAQAPPPLSDAGAAQTNALLQPATTAANASQATSHVEHAARAAPASAQVAREIVRQFDGENTRFELRLDPPELGRVEVRLEVSRDNRVTAVVTADNPQALAELARHARDLEQMLQSSGLELTDSGLSFDLRQGGDFDAEAGDGSSNNARGGDAEPETQTAQTSARPLGLERWRGVRVDIMA